MKRKVFFVALLCSFSLSACGGGSTTTTEAPTETSIEESTAEETVTEEDAVEENSASVDDSDGWGSVRALGLDNSTMLSIYQDYQDAWESSPEDPIAKRDYEAQVDEEIAEKYETWPSTVRYWFRKRGIKPEVLRGNKKSTGRKCSSCIYRQLNPNLGNCDYICKTGHSRGCSAINCDKYVKGRPIASMKETVEDYDIFDE